MKQIVRYITCIGVLTFLLNVSPAIAQRAAFAKQSALSQSGSSFPDSKFKDPFSSSSSPSLRNGGADDDDGGNPNNGGGGPIGGQVPIGNAAGLLLGLGLLYGSWLYTKKHNDLKTILQ
jgi:hypothetical protein